MPHSYAVDTTSYCRVRTFARSGVFEDSDLIDGNLEFWLDWTSGPIKPFLGWDAGESLRNKIVGVGACGTSSPLAWTSFLGNVLVDGAGKAYGATSSVAYISATGFNGSVPWTRTSLDLSCKVTLGSGGAGLAWRLENENLTFGIYLQTSSLRLKVEKRNSGSTIVQTGTTVLVQGNTYLLRVTCDADGNWETFIDGVSQGTFTDNALSTRYKWGLVTRDTDSRIYDVEGQPSTTCPATSYDVVNDEGVILASGAVASNQSKIVVPDSVLVQRDGRGPYGGYKLRLYGASSGNYGAAKGNTTFTRVVSDARFSAKPLPFTSTTAYGGSSDWDVGLRSFFGLGATRFAMDVGTPATAAAYLQTNYVDLAGVARPRYTIGHYRHDNAGRAAEITAFVAANSDVFQAWEPFNEPQDSPAASFAADQVYFYDAVKAGNPDAIVLGPNPVSYLNAASGIGWIEDFLDAGGADGLDGLSVHAYNCTNGDIAMGRRLIVALRALADQYDLPMWQTEQGHQTQLGNQYGPPHALRWTAVQLMVQECNGLPLERNVVWYDVEHGFSGSSQYWHDKTSAYAVPVMVRTMAAEIGDRSFVSEYDLGDWLDLYVCGLWTGADTSSVIGVLAQSKGMPDVRFYLTGATSVTAVDAFGNEFTLTRDENQVISVPTSEYPTWVRLPVGVEAALVATDWDGTNIATTATVTAPTGLTYNKQALVSPTLENQLDMGQQFPIEAAGFMFGAYGATIGSSAIFPQTITATLPTAQTATRVVLASSPIWQSIFSTPTDFDIDISPDGSSWTTIYSHEPEDLTTTWYVSDILTSNTTFDAWFTPQTVWDLSFDSQPVKAVRVVLRNVSWGMHETEAASIAVWGGTSQVQWVGLRGLRLYDATQTFDPDRPRFNLTVTCSG